MTALHHSTIAAIERLAKAHGLEITAMEHGFVAIGDYAAFNFSPPGAGDWSAAKKRGKTVVVFGRYSTPLQALRRAILGAR